MIALQRLLLVPLLAALSCGGALLAEAAHASPLIVVPPGNRSETQPPIPDASATRTRAFKTTYAEKYEKIVALLKREKKLVAHIKQVAAGYDIDPIHIVGALVGEHTYNVTAVGSVQTYYVKALSYSGLDFAFRYKGVPVQTFVQRPEFAACAEAKDSASLWSCRDKVWVDHFRGKTVDGVTYDAMTFQQAFFQPFFAGQTFGLGQISPLTALEVTDLVNKVSGYDRLTPDHPQAIYRDVMDPDRSIVYIAAIVRDAIDAYKEQGFDISGNPGITATLYNVGQPRQRAADLHAALAGVKGRKLPVENYYGWLVNDKLDELRSLLDSGS
ncbi:hypothetical protein MesoLj131b_45250 [Mesorhizobium sp. 131-2-5]|uniref:DUF1402 family protein n=1 Tax=Mesorhizobium sp. 131-2-5 TaxID=2744519 RepID=UPI001936BACB|nr:DUF1402 family protein [Mesorhizobium sp. 131-2-5]BCH02526.1 hypothetical protein MesoLj131b_45250 [Mesorhizobium sp. 131-2-5]